MTEFKMEYEKQRDAELAAIPESTRKYLLEHMANLDNQQQNLVLESVGKAIKGAVEATNNVNNNPVVKAFQNVRDVPFKEIADETFEHHINYMEMMEKRVAYSEDKFHERSAQIEAEQDPQR